jgi:PAS domain S-box-containing protein
MARQARTRPRAAPPAGGQRAEPVAIADVTLDEIESVAQIGSYAADLVTGRWAGSAGLDAILGIDAAFERSVEGWVSLIHPDERAAMVTYFTEEVAARGQPFDRRYRILRADSGEERWVHGRGRLEFDGSGRPIRMLGTIADITEQHRAQEALRASEARYAAILEGTAEAILIADAATYRYVWVNAAACALLGYTRDELLGMRVHDLHPASALTTILSGFGEVGDGRISEGQAVPCLRKDGSVLFADIRSSTALVAGALCNIAFFTDATELRELDQALRRSERNLAEAQRVAAIGSWEWDLATGTALRSEELHRIYGIAPGELAPTTEAVFALIHPDDRARVEASVRTAIAGGDRHALEYRVIRPDGRIRIIREQAEVHRDAQGVGLRMFGTTQDVTDQVTAEAERSRLAMAVEQTSDAVLITDLAGTIEYVNPAFEAVSGYRRAEVTGKNPRILKSGRQSAAFYRAMWEHLAGGRNWTGRFINRRADGSLYQVEATISPIHDTYGALGGYIGVQRDVTALQAARSGLASEFRERAQVAAALARLQPAASAAETAADICDELLGLPGIDLAAIFNLVDPQHATTLAWAGPDGAPLAPGRPLPVARATYLFERAMQGPWAETWHTRPEDGRYGRLIAGLGLRASAFAPVRNGEGLLGLVAVGTTDAAYARHLVDHLPAVGEFAATASALLARDLEGDHRRTRLHAQIARIIGDRAFHPVFQRIVDLHDGRVVGHEALTRFDDGTRPDHRFADAWTADLGPELELATLEAAITLARGLPAGAWLDVNVSPRLLADPGRVRRVLARADRPLIVEITEHDPVADYRALRAALALLGPSVRTAVDDAGAGIANFAHIVELRPEFVKLDIGLIRGVDADLGRQAMVVAMRHFARTAGCRLIGEGVETHAEARSLAALGVDFGQGYFYGRPETVALLAAERRRAARA